MKKKEIRWDEMASVGSAAVKLFRSMDASDYVKARLAATVFCSMCPSSDEATALLRRVILFEGEWDYKECPGENCNARYNRDVLSECPLCGCTETT